jgi:replication factor C subunit 1
VAKEAGRDLLEFNASDARSKKALQTKLGDITGSQALNFGKAGEKAKSQQANKFRCIIMDEVDGMGAGDRSGMAELIQMIKKSKVPIICICNDRQSQKMKSLLPYCMDLRFKRPVKSVMARRAVRIAQEEGLQVEVNAAEAIAESCGNDVRQVLNVLQMWASKGGSSGDSALTYKGLKERESAINKDEILRVSLFDAAKTIMEGRRNLAGADPKTEVASIMKRSDAFFVDYSLVGLLVQQNYPKVMMGQHSQVMRDGGHKAEEAFLKRMYEAANSMSDYAMVENEIRSGDQNWSLLPCSAMLTVQVGYHAGGPNGGMLPGFPEFTSWMGKNSTKGKKLRLLGELHHHMNFKISGGTMDMRQTYLPVLRSQLLTLLQTDQTQEAIRLMDEYGLSREDVMEKLDEFKMSKDDKSFADIDSKKKAAFTREYNAGSHKSQALIDEQGAGPKKKGKGAKEKDPADLDAIDEDAVEEESDDDVEEDFEKLKAQFKKKGRKKAAPKKKDKK